MTKTTTLTKGFQNPVKALILDLKLSLNKENLKNFIRNYEEDEDIITNNIIRSKNGNPGLFTYKSCFFVIADKILQAKWTERNSINKINKRGNIKMEILIQKENYFSFLKTI